MTPSTASDIMRTPVITVSLDTTVGDAARLMLSERIGSLVVIDKQEEYRGVVTEQAFLPYEEGFPLMRGTVSRVMGVNTGADASTDYLGVIEKLRDLPLSEVLGSESPTASPDTSIEEIAELMASSQRQHVPIIVDNKPVGIVARHDILKLFVR